jgi:CelD/BcsL family acetyltransferase involved in cellulose biosynthesis
MMISVQRIPEDEFALLPDAWNGLLARSRANSPMLTWEWAYSWWESYRDADARRDLRVLTARGADGELLGLAPFVLRRRRQFGLAWKRLEFIGTGEAEADETCSEFLDLIVDHGREADVLEALVDALRRDGEWGDIVCRDVRREGSAAARAMKSLAAGAGGEPFEEFGHARCPFVALPRSWEEYLATLSRNGRRLVRHKRRAAEANGAARFVVSETPDDVQRDFAEFARLHRQRWQTERPGGCFASRRFEDFMARLTPRLAECGGVRIASLLVRGEPAACYYLLRHAGAVYYYNSGMDLARFAELSPGSVCLGHAIEDAIRRGETEFHFFKGGADSYKYHWTDRAVPVVSLRLRRPGWRLGLCALAERLRRRAAGMRGRSAGGVRRRAAGS